uniref:Uncharacterized protein n=1 Tax=Mola mola TaxID=94237 RepID=A0A3Q3W5N0_MOLML
MFPCVWSCLPDPEELGAFTDLYGSLRLLVSFKVHFIFNSVKHQNFSSLRVFTAYKEITQKNKIKPPECVNEGCWCQGGHPVVGDRLPLSIPPEVMDQGLFGELSVQLVTVLSPCVLQYPNLATRLTHVQISFAYLQYFCDYH